MEKKHFLKFLTALCVIHTSAYTFYKLETNEKPKIVSTPDWDALVNHSRLLFLLPEAKNACDGYFERQFTKNFLMASVNESEPNKNLVICVEIDGLFDYPNVSRLIGEKFNFSYQQSVAIGQSVPVLSFLATMARSFYNKKPTATFDYNTFLNFPLNNLHNTKKANKVSAEQVDFIFTNLEPNDVKSYKNIEGIFLFVIFGGHKYTQCRDDDKECRDNIAIDVFSETFVNQTRYRAMKCLNINQAYMEANCVASSVIMGNPKTYDRFKNGGIFYVPYDYKAALKNPIGGPTEPLIKPKSAASKLSLNQIITLIITICIFF